MSDKQLPPVPDAYDWEAFRANAHKTIDLVVDYHIAIQKGEVKKVQSEVEPGYLVKRIGDEPPEAPVAWDVVNNEIKDHILPGITHWQHPNFFAFFPSLVSPPALLGDMVSNAVNQPGFNWVCSPAATELEIITMDWLRKAFDFPEQFSWKGSGGGIIQPTATEAMIVAMTAARNKVLGDVTDEAERSKKLTNLVCYYSDQSHFCVEKACRVLAINHMRKVPSKDAEEGNRPVDVEAMRSLIAEDKAAGRVPFFISANFGATGICAVDPLEEIGQLAKANNCWYNLDAAYAGVAAMLPEVRPQLAGLEHCDSILINGSKWFSTMFNCGFMWFSEKKYLVASLNATGVYLENEKTSQAVVHDLKDYHLGLGRPFRSLKLFTTIRSFGLQGLRDVLRRHIELAQFTAGRLEESGLFDVRRAKFGLICFRLKDQPDAANGVLLSKLNTANNMFMVHTVVGTDTIIRMSLAYPRLDQAHMVKVVEEIVETAKSL